MSCNKIKPPKFTKEQMAECHQCKMISGKKVWCGHFGIYVIKQYPSKRIMANNIITDATKYIKAGRPKRSKIEQELLIDICKKCPEFVEKAVRCLKCGCCLNIKKRWATASCPLGKW